MRGEVGGVFAEAGVQPSIWGMFDACLRPVDSPPVGIQFLDPRQQPIKLQPYRLNAPKLAFLKDTIKEWIEDGIIRPSESPWGFPVVIVPKPRLDRERSRSRSRFVHGVTVQFFGFLMASAGSSLCLM